jgi:hypothetical protein
MRCAAYAQGVPLAKKNNCGALKYLSRIYLIMPFLRYETASELARFA